MADPDEALIASAAEVEAAQKAMGCSREEFVTRKGSAEVVCRKHQEYAPDFKSILAGEWTDRGCPVAVTVADAVVAVAQPRIAAETLREAAQDISEGHGISTFIGADPLPAAVRAEKRAQDWLRERADRIEARS